LRLYTQQHYLPNGKLDLVEDYDPNEGGPIVYYYWSNHYNHSSYNNLIITGLCGIRPSTGDTLVINPLLDDSIQYFCLDGLSYHGHTLSVIFDREGTRYKLGKGITVIVDGRKAVLAQRNGKFEVAVGTPILHPPAKQTANFALNIMHQGYPLPSASINAVPDSSLYQAIDGRIWYFPEITNRWSTLGSTASTDWYAIDFGQPHEVSSVKLYLFADGNIYAPPKEISMEYQNGDNWLPVKISERLPATPVGNTVNAVIFNKVTARRLKIIFGHEDKQVAISELETY
jgi:Glycosyl hydrolase family 65, C-terminal domain/F5/8 type C domain